MWFNRRSSSLAKGGRGSLQDGKGPVPHGSRSEDRHSKIPVRSSSQTNGGASEMPSLVRSKSNLDMASTPQCTPQAQFLFTPKLYSGQSNKKPGKDQRNLQDKDFQREASSLVLYYFQTKYPVALKGSDIRPMTIKMFIDMVNHLFERLAIYNKDALVQFTTANYEKDLPMWMKYLEYPASVTRGWIQTVNVPQYWPQVLGLLSWLVTLVTACCDCFDVDKKINEIARADRNKHINIEYFFACVRTHILSNSGKADSLNDECRNLIRFIEEEQGLSDEAIEQLKAENTRLQELINDSEVKTIKDALDELQQRLTVAKSQAIKASEEAIIKNANIADIDREISKKEGNIAILKSHAEKFREEVESLKNKVDKQAMSIGQFSKLKKQCDYLLKEIEYAEKECEDNDKLVCRYDQDIATKRDKIMQNEHAFNRNIIQLSQHIPELAGLRARLDPERASAVEDVEKLVIALKEMKISFQTRLNDEAILRREREEAVEQLKSRLAEVIAHEQKIRASIDEDRAEIARLQGALIEREESLRGEIKNLETQKSIAEQKLKECENLKSVKASLEHRNEMLAEAKAALQVKQEELWQTTVQKMIKVSSETAALMKRRNLILDETFKQCSISENY